MRYTPEQEVECNTCGMFRVFRMERIGGNRYSADATMRRLDWSPHEDLCPNCIRERKGLDNDDETW